MLQVSDNINNCYIDVENESWDVKVKMIVYTSHSLHALHQVISICIISYNHIKKISGTHESSYIHFKNEESNTQEKNAYNVIWLVTSSTESKVWVLWLRNIFFPWEYVGHFMTT